MSPLASFRLILDTLESDGRRRLWWLALATVAGAVIEFALLAALVGLLRQWFNQTASAVDGRAVALFVGFALAAGAIRFALLTLTQRLAFDTGHRLIVAVQRRILARDWPTHVAARTSGPIASLDFAEQWVFSTLR